MQLRLGRLEVKLFLVRIALAARTAEPGKVKYSVNNDGCVVASALAEVITLATGNHRDGICRSTCVIIRHKPISNYGEWHFSSILAYVFLNNAHLHSFLLMSTGLFI